jgi:hypothetical protein
MSFLTDIVAGAAPDLSQQIDDAKSTAQQVAGAVAGWAAFIAIELGVVIWLLARKRSGV